MDELGIEPGPRLHQLEQAILRQDDSLSAAADERTLTATALFLDLGIRGEVEAVAGRALAIGTEERGAHPSAVRVERGLADALLAVFVEAPVTRSPLRPVRETA